MWKKTFLCWTMVQVLFISLSLQAQSESTLNSVLGSEIKEKDSKSKKEQASNLETASSAEASDNLSSNDEKKSLSKNVETGEKNSSAEIGKEFLEKISEGNPKDLVQKRKKAPAKKLSKKQIEQYFKRGIESGAISIEQLNRLEKKYLRSEQKYEPYVNTHPYMPHRWDYGIEVGSMWLKEDLYWLGGNLGHNIGTCMFSKYRSCQQYLDVLLGTSGREGVSNYYGVLSLRWQYIDFPKTYSALARVFGGVMNGIANDEAKKYPVYGVGLGISSYLHPRADLRWEIRYGQAGALGSFTQLFVSVELKVSRWIEFFADKLGDAGKGTRKYVGKGVRATGEVIKSGVDKTKSVIEKTVDE